jgi:peptide/nickel transport system substrate-binding protein
MLSGFSTKVITILLSFVLLIAIVPTMSVGQSNYVPPHNKPGPAVDILRFRSFHVDVAPQEIIADQMDMYYFGLKVTAARDIRNTPGIKVHEAPTSTISLLLNPAPGPEGQLNPFSIKEVRQAIHFIVNRDFVVQEIYKGMAVPMLTHVSSFDSDYLTLYDMLLESSITYDPDYARGIVHNEMINAGAELVEGKWHYNGKPIRIDFIIRVEDERRDVGDLIRSEVENLGFIVQPTYQQFGPAIFAVYSTDPNLVGTGGSWHMYTEGWGKGSANRYDSGTLNQMCAPWLGNMPGWQEQGYWQYESPDLDELSQKIFSGDFENEQDRNSIYVEASKLCLDESVRLWIANIITNLPANDKIEGISSDIIAGPKSLWTQRDAHIPGKNDLTIGNVWVWTERTTWNPVGGFGDLYGSDIWRNMYDPPITRHPFTGLPIPYRANYDITTSGPSGTLQIPSDSFVWNAETSSWSNVPAGSVATSKVVFDYSNYFNSKWHHGESITMADVIYSIHQTFDLTYNDEKSSMEFAIATVSKPYLDSFKGFRIVDDNKLEVYVDFWHFAPDYIADYASITSITMPWEILYSMDTLVFDQRKAAYSDTAAQRFNVPWLSLVMDRDARLVRSVLREHSSDNNIPLNVFTVQGKQLVSTSDAQSRYNSALSWFDEYKMLVISNGPFMLKIYDPPAQYAELIAFRDETYPFKPGQFYYGSANLVEIVDINTNFIELNSDNEIIMKLIGEGNLGLRYALINEINNEILSKGIASEKSTNEFVINLDSTLTSNLRPGFYKLHLAGFSDTLSSVSARVIVLEAVSDRPVAPVVSQQINEEKPQSENPINQNNIDEKPQSEESSSLILPLIVALVIIIGGVFVMQRSQTTSKRVVRKTSSRSRSSKKSGLKSSKKTTKKTTATKKTISTKKPKKSIRKSSKKST